MNPNYVIVHLFNRAGYPRSVALKFYGDLFNCLREVRGLNWHDGGHSYIDETLYEMWRGEKFDCVK